MPIPRQFADDKFDPDDTWDDFSQSVKPHAPSKTAERKKLKPRPRVSSPDLLPGETLTDVHNTPQPQLTPVMHARTRKGKTPRIQGKLDLHGFTQEHAFKRLCGVVHSSCSNGVRFILVITGKGNPLTGTGVIQRELPRWCQMSALSTHIISCEFAPPNLGGEGAYILHLRTKKT